MSYTFQVKASEVKAVLLAAPTKDIRFYLNSVLFEFAPKSVLNLVATDGARVHGLQTTARYGDDGAPRVPSGTQILIPEDVLRRVKVGRRDDDLLTITATPTKGDSGVERWSITIRLSNGVSFETADIEGRFPDYKRLFPNTKTAEGYGSRAPGVTLWPEFLLDARKAFDALAGGPNSNSSFSVLFHENETQPVLVVSREHPHFFALISARRDNDYTSADIPDWVAQRAEEFA